MYSRYTLNASGGHDRRVVPDPPPPTAASGADSQSPPAARPQVSPGLNGDREPREALPKGPGPPPARQPAPPVFSQDGYRRAPHPPTPPVRPANPVSAVSSGMPFFGGLFGPDNPLSRLLPRGFEAEELLVLAVLLLSMQQDGAAPLELLIAAAIYLWF